MQFSKINLRRPLALLTGVVAAAALTTATASAAPVIDRSFGAPTPNLQADPFYTPPATIPVGEPGDVIRARPAKAGPPTARALANAWQVMYLSTDGVGQRNVVTGTILVPKGKDLATVPVVGLAPGTTGPAFKCAVSRFINSGAFYEQAIVNGLLKAGYAVAVTDYEGYHENPETTYITGKAMGAALIDAVRAASRLPDSGLPASPSKVLFQGYSQGGGASMWAGQMEPTYAPELNLIGVSAGGVPSDLASVALSLEAQPGFGFLMNALIGLDNAYPGLDLASYLNSAGTAAFTAMEQKDCTAELLMNYQGKRVSEYTTRIPFLEPAWVPRLIENVLGKSKIEAPVYQYHATNDQIVPFGQAAELRTRYCALGMQVQFRTFDTGHVTTVARGNADALAFIADRVAGKPATSNCGT